MKKRVFIIIIMFCLLYLFVGAPLSSADSCKKPKPPGPPPDHADDNYSFNIDGNQTAAVTPVSPDFEQSPSIGILNSGNMEAMDKLLNKIGETCLYVEKYFNPQVTFRHVKVLIVPTGGLFGMENDTTFKHLLAKYVGLGGNIVCLAQQDTDDFSILPEGSGGPLKAYGWREDQSCYSYSIFYDTMHPILSSQTNQRITAGVDGYFSTIPADSTVLLRRRKNHTPALLYYPAGAGKVFAASLFSDWALAHSQATRNELNLIRDLISFAKNPDLPIPMINLAGNPTPVVELDVKITNNTETQASKVKLTVYSPNRQIVLHEEDQNISLDQNQNTAVPINFTLPSLGHTAYGICHVYYELYDSDDQLLQWRTESDSGRFALYRILKTYHPNPRYSAWVTAAKDFYYWNQQAQMVLHVKNHSSEPITMDWYYDWTHQGYHLLPALTVPANGELNYPIQVDILQRSSRGQNTEMFWLWNRIDQNSSYRTSAKGITVKHPGTLYNKISVNPDGVKIGAPVNYSFSFLNSVNTTLEDVNIKIFLEQRQWPDYRYETITEISDTTQNLSPRQYINRSGTYTHPEILPIGMYRLKMVITRPDQSQSTAFCNFSFLKSYVNVKIDTLKGSNGNYADTLRYLEVNESYPFTVRLYNRQPRWSGTRFDIENGACTLIMETESGETVFQKEISGIQIHSGQGYTISENFTFRPTKPGKYYLRAKYKDETGTVIETSDNTFYTFKNTMHILQLPFKGRYNYGETIDVTAKIKGSGTFNLKITSAMEEFEEVRALTLSPENNNTLIESFQIPTTFANKGQYGKVRALLTSTDPNCSGNAGVCSYSSWFTVNRAEINVSNMTGTFAELTARVGDPIDFTVGINGTSGFVVPINGQLRVRCSSLGFDETRTADLAPGQENLYNYSIPVATDTPAGTHRVYATYRAENLDLISKSFLMKITAPDIKIVPPARELTAGTPITLTVENYGGKDGRYQIDSYLRGPKGQHFADYSNSVDIAAGQQTQFDIPLPANLKSGGYTLYQTVKETYTGKVKDKITQHQVTGLSATLNGYTLKEKYFDNETVSGKSDITSGTMPIQNGILNARILENVSESGITRMEPGEFALYNNIHSGTGNNGKLYLVNHNRLFDYDPVAKTSNLLLELPDNGQIKRPYFDSQDTLWLTTTRGAYCRNTDGTWTTYVDDSWSSNHVDSITEYRYPDGERCIWVGTGQGISQLKDGQWTSYTTADGLPSNRVLKFATDGSGVLWISTSGGLIKFDGNTFVSADAPFGNTAVFDKLCSAADGSVWTATNDTLYRWNSGTWEQWDFAGQINELYISELCADDNDIWVRCDNLMIKYDGNFSIITADSNTKLRNVSTLISFPGTGMYFGYGGYTTRKKDGFLSYDNQTWEKIHIEKDMAKLLDTPTCLAHDNNGTLWVGTESGISSLNGASWQSYIVTSGGESIGEVYDIQSAPANKVYALSEAGIIRIENNQLTLIPPAPDHIEGYLSDARMCIDTLGRIWYSYFVGDPFVLAFYEDGQWNQYG
ncbi:MAG: hypothetical protein GY757_13940, partial [bacterium]|nr:hypothetical protein [bacterium]